MDYSQPSILALFFVVPTIIALFWASEKLLSKDQNSN